jgi:hypothetical protein
MNDYVKLYLYHDINKKGEDYDDLLDCDYTIDLNFAKKTFILSLVTDNSDFCVSYFTIGDFTLNNKQITFFYKQKWHQVDGLKGSEISTPTDIDNIGITCNYTAKIKDDHLLVSFSKPINGFFDYTSASLDNPSTLLQLFS